MKLRKSTLALFLIPCLCHAGGWTQKKGDYYTKLSLTSLLTEQQYGLDGRKSTQDLRLAAASDSSNADLLIQDQNFTRLWGGLIYGLSARVQLSVEACTLVAGKNTIAGQTIYIGLALLSP